MTASSESAGADAPESARDVLTGAEIRSAGLRGVRFTLLARPIVECVLLASMVILARLVSPADFGRWAVALVFGELMLIPGQAVGTALVQRRESGMRYLQTGMALSLLICLSIAGLTWLLAEVAVAPVFDERTALLVRLSTVLCPLNAVNIVPAAVLQRQLAFRRLSILDVGNTSVRVVASIALAVAGFGAVGLVLGSIVGATAGTVLLWVWARPPWPRWHRREARDLTTYGGPAALAAMSWVGFRNCDYAIVGARLGPLAAGYYFRAYTLGVEYQSKVGMVMDSVGFPLLARAHHGEQQADLRRRMVRLLTLILYPALALLAITGPRFIPWLFGPRWAPVVAPAQILVIGGAATLVINAVGTALMAAGRTRAMLGYGWAHFLTYALVVVIVSPLGLVAVATGAAVVHSLFLGVAYALLGERRASRPRDRLLIVLRELWDDVAPAAVPSLGLVAAALAISHALAPDHPAVLPDLAAVGTGGAIAYVVALRLLYPSALNSLLAVIGHLAPAGLTRRTRRIRLVLSPPVS